MGVQMKRMLGGAAAVVVLLVASEPAAAQEPAADTARVHVVRRGDTLWDLARQYLQNPYQWRRIYEANTAQVENPHWIYPAERLLIPGLSPLRGAAADAARAAAGQDPRYAGMMPEDFPRTVFYPRPGLEGRTLMGPDDTPSATVASGEFYSAGVLLPNGLPSIGRVVEILSPTVVPVGEPEHILPFERAYMTLASPESVRRGQQVQLMTPGRRVRPHGTIYESTGIAQVIEIDGNTATIEIQEHYGPVAVGNMAVPLPAYSVPVSVRPERVEPTLEGRIIAFQEEQPVYSLRDLAFVDLGSDSGLTEGDIFEGLLDAERRGWGIRPEIPVATFRVVRVGERVSAVQVISMDYPAIEPGMTVRLVGKMPAS